MLVLAIVFPAALFFALRAMDRRFERSDRDHAVQIVKGFRPRGQRETLTTLMTHAHSAHARDLDCRGRITSTLHGTVRVTCTLDVARAATYRFDVDLGRVAIHPADATTRRFLGSLTPGGSLHD